MSASTQLTAVETAIEARLAGGAVDSYQIGNRNLKYVSLKELYDIRDRLKREISAATANASTTFAKFNNPQ